MWFCIRATTRFGSGTEMTAQTRNNVATHAKQRVCQGRAHSEILSLVLGGKLKSGRTTMRDNQDLGIVVDSDHPSQSAAGSISTTTISNVLAKYS